MRKPDDCYSEGTLKEAAERIAENAEYRKPKGKRHNLTVIILCYLYAALLGASGASEAEHLLQNDEYFKPLAKKLDLSAGIPSHTALSWMLRKTDPALLVCEFCSWTYSVLPKERKGEQHLAIDGKALNAANNKKLTGRSLYIINVVDVPMNVLLYQVRVGDKHNEMASVNTIILNLIRDKKVKVTTDAMGTQKEIFRKIAEGGSIACLPVKRNHKRLEQVIKDYVINEFMDKEKAKIKNKNVKNDNSDDFRSAKIDYCLDLSGLCESDAASEIFDNVKCCVVEEANPGKGAYPKMKEKDDGTKKTKNTKKKNNSEKRKTCVDNKSNVNEIDLKSAQEKGFHLFNGLFDYKAERPCKSDLSNKRSRLKYVKVGNYYVLMELDHGHLDRREIYVINFENEEERRKVLKDAADGWEYIKAICVVRRFRGEKDRDPQTKETIWKLSINDVAYILSENRGAEWVKDNVRQHWGCEVFHNKLDKFLDEDLHTVRKDYAPENLSMFTKMVLNLLSIRQNQEKGKGNNYTLSDIRNMLRAKPNTALDLLFQRVPLMTEFTDNN